MSDADLYRITELPADELDGASGAKRKFSFQFIGKAPNEQFPFTVANEVVSNFVAAMLGFEVPPVLPTVFDAQPLAMVLWFKHASARQDGPPMTSAAMMEHAAKNAYELHGAIVLDLFLANTDRALGPSRRNIAFNDGGKVVLFDFGNALFYRNRDRLGITAGINRLDAVEADMRTMFDKQQERPQEYYFQALKDWPVIEDWCEKIRQIPDFAIDAAVERIPSQVLPPNMAERQRLREFLKKRRQYLLEHIKHNTDLFQGLGGGAA